MGYNHKYWRETKTFSSSRLSAFIKWTGRTLAMALPWWQHHKHYRAYYYYYIIITLKRKKWSICPPSPKYNYSGMYCTRYRYSWRVNWLNSLTDLRDYNVIDVWLIYINFIVVRHMYVCRCRSYVNFNFFLLLLLYET